MNLYLGLVHHPINNKQGEIVTTSVTNLDIHDISRTCRTFGVARYFLVTPIKAQQELVGRILGYWETDGSNEYNPDRHDALSLATLVDSIDDAIAAIRSKEQGTEPLVVVTSARIADDKKIIDEKELFRQDQHRPILLLFGTGHGLADSVIKRADFCLAPIVGLAKDGYNHLSVRSAVAIYAERLAQAGLKQFLNI